MAKKFDVLLPKLGESIVSAIVVRWFKKVGDRVALDEPLLEVSTDKVNSEIPSPVAGVLEKIVAEVDQEVEVGGLLAVVSSEGGNVSHSKAPQCPHVTTSSSSGNEDLLSPSVMRLLREKGIDLADLDKIPRTGEGGRLTKKDIENYNPKKAVHSHERGDTERVKMSAMRKAIAENMVRSFYEAPHASLLSEVDVTELVEFIQKKKHTFLEKHSVKLSITAFVARAICRALEEFPLINSSLDGDTIVMKKFVNLGIAVSVDQGVMVPVIRGCHSLDLVGIAKQVSLFAEKARTHTLNAQDVKEGTITMTNFGMTGTMVGIPIIRFPEVAIVGLGAITKKPAVLKDGTIGPRSILWVSLTFDHRVLDGIYGCNFLSALRKHLEEDSDF